jgi:hypothetical protein
VLSSHDLVVAVVKYAKAEASPSPRSGFGRPAAGRRRSAAAAPAAGAAPADGAAKTEMKYIFRRIALRTV